MLRFNSSALGRLAFGVSLGRGFPVLWRRFVAFGVATCFRNRFRTLNPNIKPLHPKP